MKRATWIALAMSLAAFVTAAEPINFDSPITSNKIVFKSVATWPPYVRGHIGDVKMLGNHVYALVAGNLIAYKVSEKGVLEQRGVLKLNGGGTWGLFIDARVAYAIGSDGIAIVDITNPDMPVLAGRHTAVSDARKLVVSGAIAYICDNGTNIQIVGVSEPTKPQTLGVCKFEHYIDDFAIVGNRMYVLCDGLSIWDITNPANARSISFFQTAHRPIHLEVKGEIAYVVDNCAALNLVNISSAESPRLVSTLCASILENAPQISLFGKYAYLANHRFRVIDVSDAKYPHEINHSDWGFTQIDAGAKWLVGGGKTLTLLDISNPSAVVQSSSIDMHGIVQDVRIRGNYAYIADGNAFQILDVSNPRQPVALAREETPGYSESLFLAGDYAYIADSHCPNGPSSNAMDFGLQIFDISNPSHPRKANEHGIIAHNHCSDVFVVGDYAYWRDKYWRLVDVSDRKQPKIITRSAMSRGGGQGDGILSPNVGPVCVIGSYIYAIRAPNSLQVYNATNPLRPVIVGKCDASNKPLSIYGGDANLDVCGNYAFLGSAYSNDMYIIDITDPSNMRLVASQQTAAHGLVQAQGRYVYVADKQGSNRLQVFDVVAPGHPTLAGECVLPQRTSDFRVFGDFIYACAWGNLVILKKKIKYSME